MTTSQNYPKIFDNWNASCAAALRLRNNYSLDTKILKDEQKKRQRIETNKNSVHIYIAWISSMANIGGYFGD